MDRASFPGAPTCEGVIETFVIDWPVLVFLGLVFGALAGEESWWRSRAFVAGAITAAVFTAIALVSYLVAPDWMWMYFLDPDDAAWAVPLVLVGYLASFVLGFAAAVSLRRLGAAAIWTALALSLVAEVAVVALTWDRYHLIGTADEWRAGAAHELLTTTPTGPARTIGLLGPVFAVVLVAAFVFARRSRHEARSSR